jgi:hypothetical protein
LLLLLSGHPVARVVGHSIRYEYEGSTDLHIRSAYLPVYLLATVVPFFVCTARLTRTIGTILIVSLAIAALVELNALASVWCFFAAILSSLVLLAVERERRAHPV